MDEPINLVLFSGTDDKLQAAAVLTAGAAALGAGAAVEGEVSGGVGAALLAGSSPLLAAAGGRSRQMRKAVVTLKSSADSNVISARAALTRAVLRPQLSI